MSELLVTVFRLGYLAVLWLFVLAAMGVLRRDIFGTRVLARGSMHPTTPRSRAKAAPGPEPGKRGVPTRMQVTGGRMSGTTLNLGTSSIMIGRDPSSTLVLDDDYASSRHARIFPQHGLWYVEDLGSTNGTLLGEVPVESAMEIRPGVPVRIGQTVIELR